MIKDILKEYKDVLAIAKKYRHLSSLLYFDFETMCPSDAMEEESEMMNYFENEEFKLLNSDRMKQLIQELYNHKDELDELDRVLVMHKYEDFMKEKNITPEEALEASQVYSKAFIDWQKAREQGDFSLFSVSLGKVLDKQKEFILKRENRLPDLYDNMLDDCEKGVLQEDLDKFFNELKQGLMEILSKIKNSKHQIRTDFLKREIPDYKQKELGIFVLKLQEYDFNKGALTETEHPFTMNIAKNDARVTTHYYKDMPFASLFSCIHEGGHGIFMQNEPAEDHDHFINDSITNGMHESVSRFYENVIGRSKEYIHVIYPEFKRITSPIFDDVSEQELYEGINLVEPSLIRTEADEVTYGLHIIIRYEMEKMISNGTIKYEDIPAKWNELYKEYLGIDVPNDRLGVLQDVHWTGGFGYFPSYALGNAYNQMYLRKMEEEFSLKEAILNKEFGKIKDWLIKHVFIHANRLEPKEWIKEITGESLTPKYFLEYLDKKYKDIYKY